MENTILSGRLRKFEIPGRVTFANGNGGLPKINITTGRSTAEIYLHGAHITGFQKNGEPPLLFMSRLSQFAAGKAIRGGVPICFPWFGQREGDVMHGFARITEWNLIEAAATPDGGVTIRFRLPSTTVQAAWPAFRAEFVVTVTDQLTMELMVTNESADRNFDFENCLHTYFAVGDIRAGFHRRPERRAFLDKQRTSGARKLEIRRRHPHHGGNQPRLSRHDRHGGNPRRKISADNPRGKIQFPFHRRLESVDDAKNAGRLRPGGTPANGLRGIRQREAKQNLARTGRDSGVESRFEQPRGLKRCRLPEFRPPGCC